MSDETIIIIVLAALGALLLAAASSISQALVRFRARRLPKELADRMEEEWMGELNALAGAPARLAFALALFLTRRRAFAAPGEDFMSGFHDRPAARLSVFNSRRTLLLLSTAMFAIAAYGASFLLPVRYESQSVILVRPLNVPAEFVREPPEDYIKTQISSLLEIARSRTALLHIAREFNLGAGRHNDSPDGLVEDMQKNIAVLFTPSTAGTNSIGHLVVRYVGSDPQTAQRVAQKLAQYLIEAAFRDRQAMGSGDFLKRRLDVLAERLEAKGNDLARERAAKGPAAGRMLAIDYDLLLSTYKALFAKYEDAQLAYALEAEQKGAVFAVVDAANPGQPVPPHRLAIAGIGAMAGLILGGVGAIGLNRRQRRAIA